jgi:hypothetical protein
MQKLLFLLFIFISFSASSQTIEGTVKDTEGNILPFASILVKGTPMGVTANKEGKFSIHLLPGSYTLDCRYVGYTSNEKQIIAGSGNQTVNFILTLQKLTLKEVIIKENAEDPAYEIIRNAIKKRSFYQKQVKAFEAEVYIKGMINMINLPDKILGRKIPEDDRSAMGLDSSGKGIVYLTESVTKVSAEEPDKVKLEVISTRVSGNNSLGFSFPAFISFYDNNVELAAQLNPRGFVSPIADNALNFYQYKFLGSYFEDGNEVNVITVTPKRKYEPLFSGIINITENDWRIFSCNLTITKKSQLEILDTLQISQIHVPVEKNIWRIKNQVIHFALNQFGLKAEGNFINVYSKYNLNPGFPKGYFDRIVVKYDTAVNKKTHAYWDSIRPVPLETNEIKDYKTKDSALAARKDSSIKDIDSLRKKQGPVKLTQIFWSGVDRTHYSYKNNYQIKFDPLLKTLQYNTVEGLAVNPSLVISKLSKKLNSKIDFIADARYGFNNKHFNPWAGFKFSSIDAFDPDKKMKHTSFSIAGGKRVSQFFKESDITGLANSIGTLLYGRNDMKIYENYFAKTGYTKQWESGTTFLIESEYEDCLPIGNSTDFILNKKWRYRFTPNYPVQILSAQFSRHQAVVLHTAVTFQPGQQYIQFPTYKMAIGSKYPLFIFDYTKGVKNIFGSDVDYDKWSLNISDNANLKLAGSVKYSLTIGGFLNNRSVFAQDYKHYYSSYSHVAGEYVKSLQLALPYEFSNVSNFYSEFLFEHHSNGLLTNKIPVFKKLNWNLVEGANALFINPDTRYADVFVGLENIFKLFRIDAVVGFRNGFQPVYTYRIGFGGLLGDAFNVQRFKRTQKVIGTW